MLLFIKYLSYELYIVESKLSSTIYTFTNINTWTIISENIIKFRISLQNLLLGILFSANVTNDLFIISIIVNLNGEKDFALCLLGFT